MQTFQSQRQELGSQALETIVYPNRRIIRVCFFLCAGSALPSCFISILILILIISGSTYDSGAVSTMLLMGGLGSMCIWFTCILAGFLFSKKPMLAINHAGIRAGNLCGLPEVFLSWEEIEVILMLRTEMERQLAIRPKDVRQFLTQFSPLMRFFLWVNSLNGAPIIIPQSHLEKPIEEILRQLRTLYTPELRHYRVQIRPPLQ